MDKFVFAEQLRRAAERTRDFTRTLIIEPLPDAIRFDVRLNQSYDGNPLHLDERVYPDDPERIPEHRRSRLSEDQVVELLWREGAVPEWINLTIEQEDDEYTLIEVECCGRFTTNEQLLYYDDREGRHTPFHVLGPSIPPSYAPESKERYSLNWKLELEDRQALARLRDRAEYVELLSLSGPHFGGPRSETSVLPEPGERGPEGHPGDRAGTRLAPAEVSRVAHPLRVRAVATRVSREVRSEGHCRHSGLGHVDCRIHFRARRAEITACVGGSRTWTRRGLLCRRVSKTWWRRRPG